MHSLSKNIGHSIASISACEALQAARWIELGICTYMDPNTKGPPGPQHGMPRALLRRQSLEMAQLQIEGKRKDIFGLTMRQMSSTCGLMTVV